MAAAPAAGALLVTGLLAGVVAGMVEDGGAIVEEEELVVVGVEMAEEATPAMVSAIELD